MNELVGPETGEKLPDHASERDDRALGIDRVGIKDLSYPIQVHDRHNTLQHTVARVNLAVSLPHDFKGTHMSRFIEVLNARRGLVTIQNMPSILGDIQTRLEADVAHIELSFPYFISKHAPKSGVESLMEYICTFKATKRGPHVDFVLCVRVPVKSLCPCSKAISTRGAHNQRSIVDVEVRAEDDRFIWIEEIVEAVERCASAPLFALLKREDEKYVTELAFDNPKFVEDLVRDVVLAVRGLGGVRWLRVAAENQESIHNHAAYAEIVWSAEEAGHEENRSTGAPPSAEEAEPFGAWLRGLRVGRGYSQQAFADHLGVTGAHMSRVESGDKGLSDMALRRAAELLGLDAFDVCLRAGVVPPELLAALRARPAAAREWLRSEDA